MPTNLSLAWVIRSAVVAIGYAIVVAITINCVGNAVAVTVAHRTVAIPAAWLIHPATIAFCPAMGVIEIPRALTFPTAFCPDMAIAAPVPVARCLYIT